MPGAFDSSFEELPRVIAIFPLSGALLLPHGQLPLNIFEPRYINMTLAALAAERMFGMIQPEDEAGEPPPVYGTGCAGRLTSFSETEDGRLLITLFGVCRFDIVEELPLKDGYRRVVADYHRFRNDLSIDRQTEVDRARLIGALRDYLKQQHVDANWDAIEKTDDERLVTSLAMMCPFQVSEKQALLEAANASERARIMITLLEMANLERGGGEGKAKQ